MAKDSGAGAPAATLRWREMDADTLERQYNPRLLVPDYKAYSADKAARSAAARARLDCTLDLAYGPGPRQRLDVFRPAGRTDGTLLYVHGGAWTTLSKDVFSFVAEPFVAAGHAVVVVSYDLAPDVGLTRIGEEVREAIGWVWKEGRAHGCNPDRLWLAGMSAGAQLAGMAFAHDWTADRLPADAIRGGLVISGCYDMEPHRHDTKQASLRMTEAEASRQSPIHNLPPLPRDILVAVGALESDEFRRQAADYAAALAHHGSRARLIEVAGHHHFSIGNLLGEADSTLTRALLDLMAAIR